MYLEKSSRDIFIEGVSGPTFAAGIDFAVAPTAR